LNLKIVIIKAHAKQNVHGYALRMNVSYARDFSLLPVLEEQYFHVPSAEAEGKMCFT